MTEQTLVPGNPADWREFAVEDFDPKVAYGSDEDELGALMAERSAEDPFGITLIADLVENVPDDLVKRLAASRIPTKLQRGSSEEHKEAGKARKKHKKEKE